MNVSLETSAETGQHISSMRWRFLRHSLLCRIGVTKKRKMHFKTTDRMWARSVLDSHALGNTSRLKHMGIELRRRLGQNSAQR